MSVLQLPLRLKLRDDSIFDNFFVGGNLQLIEILKAFIFKKAEPFIYCYGESGVGRTHLLQACCHAASENNVAIFYLPLANHQQFSPQIFDDLENQQYVCIDDVDTIIGNQAWEEALFHFYNRARENKVSLLLSAKNPPQQLNYRLPDLQSRLNSGLIVAIKSLSDTEKKQALKMRANLRGINLLDDVCNYLIHHYSRNMRDLLMVFERLDQASLATKRRLTTPFVKWVMQSYPGCDIIAPSKINERE